MKNGAIIIRRTPVTFRLNPKRAIHFNNAFSPF